MPLPEGYRLYDDFEAPEALGVNWQVFNEKEVCAFGVADGYAAFACHNDTISPTVATLTPWQPLSGVVGLAAAVQVSQVGGPFQLNMEWLRPADGARRAYHLELDMYAAQAMEFYPLEDFRTVPLGHLAAPSASSHLLQIERTAGSVAFWVDGQAVPLDVAPDLPADYVLKEWSLIFYVWQDGHHLAGQIDHVSVKIQP